MISNTRSIYSKLGWALVLTFFLMLPQVVSASNWSCSLKDCQSGIGKIITWNCTPRNESGEHACCNDGCFVQCSATCSQSSQSWRCGCWDRCEWAMDVTYYYCQG